MSKITMNVSENTDEIFERFLFHKKANGLAEKTLESYNSQFKAISKHLNVYRPIEEITKADLEKMIVSMREYGLAANTIRSYTRILKVFFTWCNDEGLRRTLKSWKRARSSCAGRQFSQTASTARRSKRNTTICISSSPSRSQASGSRLLKARRTAGSKIPASALK